MGPKKTSQGRPREISKRQGKSPGQIPGLTTSKLNSIKNQRGWKNVFTGYLQHGMSLLLTALVLVGIWSSPSLAELPTDCIECHGTFFDVHGNVDHNATPPSGSVVLFADNDHDEAGWVGTPPYFAVTVDCVTCHNTYLPEVHSNDCSTCHPTPYDTLNDVCTQHSWNRGCQQGGCHTVIHEDALKAHKPFANSHDLNNDCLRCHQNNSSWAVLQTNCLNCHAAPATGYSNPPVTTSNAQPLYNGTAEIDFSINESGKVGIGRTFYKLDNGAVDSGSKVVVSASGSHQLEFWSVDQFGTKELSNNLVSFTVDADTTPPTTTSNALPSYNQGAVITLTAIDDSSLGVQNTFYTLNGGTAQTGTTINIPATPGVITYTLVFWSVDWSGNIEEKHTVTFTVTSGTGTIRLVWWDCDLYPSQAPTGTDKANWTVYRDYVLGQVVATGSGASPNWSGINDITVPVGPTVYWVRVNWWNSDEGYYEITDFQNISVTTPGQVVRLSY
jgi:hypothetical protein